MGLDWCEVEDFELFMMLVQTLTPDRTSILFGDLDFSKLKPFRNNQNGDIVLADKETGLIIDKMIYLRIVSYLRKAFNITPKVEKAANKMTKKILIDEDRAKIEAALNDLKETLKDESATKEQIDAKVKALSEASHKLAEAMYQNQTAGANAQDKKKDDDVIDAEVE